MAKGNPSPHKATQFGAKNGNPINLGGKTKAQREAEFKASEISAQLRLKALTVMQDKLASGEVSDADLDLLLSAGALKLFKDSEDRAHGTPVQSVIADTTVKVSAMDELFAEVASSGGRVGDN